VKKEFFVNKDRQESIDSFLLYITQRIDSGEPFKAVIGDSAKISMPQRSLLHIWVKYYAAMRYGENYKSIKDADVKKIKLILKQACYNEHGWSFLTERLINDDTGHSASVLRSIEDYDKGEMFMFMEFVQSYAGNKGLILESIGEYKKLKESTNQ